MAKHRDPSRPVPSQDTSYTLLIVRSIDLMTQLWSSFIAPQTTHSANNHGHLFFFPHSSLSTRPQIHSGHRQCHSAGRTRSSSYMPRPGFGCLPSGMAESGHPDNTQHPEPDNHQEQSHRNQFHGHSNLAVADKGRQGDGPRVLHVSDQQ